MFNKKITIFLQFLFANAIIATNENSFRTIVIGAGPAGIAAATRLIKNNVTDILVLEAENRIGGRVNSIQYGDVFIDLGAEWCHGQKNNFIYETVKDLNLLAETKWNMDLHHSGNEPIDRDVKNDIIKTLVLLSDDIDNLISGKPKNFTIEQLFYETYNKSVLEKYQNDSKKLKNAQDGIDFIEHCLLGLDCAFDWNDLTVHSTFEACEGNQSLNWNGNGFKTILDILLEKYPNPKKALKINDKILLNKEVTQISWGDETKNEIVIHCSDDTKYRSKSVIFTPSLGVLKIQHKTLFSPNLPSEKLDAIENIGFGAVIKVVLNFTENWWKDEDTSFFLFWTKEDKEKLLKEFPDDPLDQNGNSWLTGLTDVYRPNVRSNVLTVWLSGSAVPQIELLSDETILNRFEYALRLFLGRTYNVTKPDLVARTTWYKNPHFHGTWSYETPKGSVLGKQLRKILSLPIQSDHNKEILFAGEATHSKYFSTVHGAIETGFREADRVILSYKN